MGSRSRIASSETPTRITFATVPGRLESLYLERDEVVEIARQGAAQGCKEALFTLGDKPERRYVAARDELARLGHATTLSRYGRITFVTRQTLAKCQI